MQIVDERPGDADAIHRMTSAAFARSPHGDNGEGRIIDTLRASDRLALSLVAEDAGEIIGQVTFSPVTVDRRSGPWFCLGPVAVTVERQGEGVGDALIREGLARLEAQGAELCVLLGNPAYYRRFGFVHDPALSCGEGPPEAFQRLVFKGDAPAGRVAFDPAFSMG